MPLAVLSPQPNNLVNNNLSFSSIVVKPTIYPSINEIGWRVYFFYLFKEN